MYRKKYQLAHDMNVEELYNYNIDYKAALYTSIMETLLRYHSAASRRRKAARFQMPKKRYQRQPKFVDTIPDAIKEYFQVNQFNSQRKWLKKFDQFKIPTEPQMVRYLDYEDEKKSYLGRKVCMYESPVLRSLAFVNISHRYRGMSSSCDSIKAIDLVRLEDEDDEEIWYEERQSKLADAYLKTKPFNYLMKPARNKEHFRFLKALAKVQLVTVPFSILETGMEDVYPTFEATINAYLSFTDVDLENSVVNEAVLHRGHTYDRMQLFKRM